MSNQDFEQKIKQSYEKITPDVFDAILQGCDRKEGKVLIMNPTKNKKKIFTAIAAAAACIMLAVGVYGYNINFATAATISLDVNPSVELTVNKSNKVLSATALNAEGKIVLGEMTIEGNDAELAVNAIVGSMLRNGFITDIQNSILLTVEDADANTGEQLQQQLAFAIESVMHDAQIDGAVLSQTVSTENTAETADRYEVSDGKANLINQILAQSPTYDAVQLANLSITELGLLLDVTDDISSLGEVSDTAYIGIENALNAALLVDGVSADLIVDRDVELDFENGIMVYEIDYETANGDEYKYEINALTGEVVKREIDFEDDSLDDITDDIDDDIEDGIDDLDDIDDDLDDLNDIDNDIDDINDDIYDDYDYDDDDGDDDYDYDDDDGDDDYDYDDDDDDDDDDDGDDD